MGKVVQEHRIVVLGAGYTGLLAALQAARRGHRHGARVTLINPSDRFTERLRMHQIATGQPLRDVRIPDLLAGRAVEFVQGRAVGLDPAGREVEVETGGGPRTVGYDTLVYAIGSRADTSRVPGADLHAYTLDDPAAARRLAERLDAIRGGTVLVCGAGPTGVESAAEIADSHPEVRVLLLSRDEPAPIMGPRARTYMYGALDRLGVRIRTGVEVVKVLPDGVELAGGELVASDACLWTTGFVAPPLAGDSGITVDEQGRVVVDDLLRSTSHPDVIAVGDAAAVRQPYGVLHGSCQSGVPMAAHAAFLIDRRLTGRKPKPFRFGYLGQGLSLGRQDAVVQFVKPDDTPTRGHLTGRRAVRYKNIATPRPWSSYRFAGAVTVSPNLLRRPGNGQ
jgi:NADH dehydrogenase